MKKLLILFTIINIFSCTKEKTPEPINPLVGNWRGPLEMGPNLYEFTNDSMFEYSDFIRNSTDIICYSGYTIKGNTLKVTGAYIIDLRNWPNKLPYDTSYSMQFSIINDSLYLNGIYRGKKY